MGSCIDVTNSGTGYGISVDTHAGSAIGIDVSSDTAIAVEGTSSSGYGGYFTSSSSDGVHSISVSANGVYGQTSASGDSGVAGENMATTGNAIGVFGYSASSAGYAVYADGNMAYTGTLSHISDERLKREIEPLNGSMDQLLRLRGVSFYWREPSKHGGNDRLQRGFVAQEYEKVFPEWVVTGPDGFKMISTEGLDSLEVESIRALKTENDELRTRTAKLEERLDALQKGRDPITGGVGFGKGALCLVGLGLAGAFGISRRKRSEQRA